jgi:hypothetical protein
MHTSVAARWDARAVACPGDVIAVSVMGVLEGERILAGVRAGADGDLVRCYRIKPDPPMNDMHERPHPGQRPEPSQGGRCLTRRALLPAAHPPPVSGLKLGHYALRIGQADGRADRLRMRPRSVPSGIRQAGETTIGCAVWLGAFRHGDSAGRPSGLCPNRVHDRARGDPHFTPTRSIRADIPAWPPPSSTMLSCSLMSTAAKSPKASSSRARV